MATITCRCPSCQQAQRQELLPGAALTCAQCGRTIVAHVPNLDTDRLERCLICPSPDLFVRKDFPQRLGVAIVVSGFLASSIAWYFHMVLTTFGILLASALVDVCLYLVMGNVLECYRCHAQYRDVAQFETHPAFDLETHERYRQAAQRASSLSTTSSQSPTARPPIDGHDHH